MAEEHNQYAFREWQQAGLVAFLAGMSADGRKLVSGQDGVQDLLRDAGEVPFPTRKKAPFLPPRNIKRSMWIRACCRTGSGGLTSKLKDEVKTSDDEARWWYVASPRESFQVLHRGNQQSLDPEFYLSQPQTRSTIKSA